MAQPLIVAARQPFEAYADGQHAGRPVVGVDLGYSAKRASCGVCLTRREPRELQFGGAIEETARLLAETADALLVLEAVLSTHHNADTGNPEIRDTFERGRGWYYGPGVLTLAAAQRFLYVLAQKLPAGQTVSLAEAFLSNKPKLKEGERPCVFAGGQCVSHDLSPHALDACVIAGGILRQDSIRGPVCADGYWPADAYQPHRGWEPASPLIRGVPEIRVFRPWDEAAASDQNAG